MPIHSMQKQADADMLPTDELSMAQESALDHADITDPISVIEAGLDFDDPSSSEGSWYTPKPGDGDGDDYQVELDGTEGAGFQGKLDFSDLNGQDDQQSFASEPNEPARRQRPRTDIHSKFDQTDDSSGYDQFSPQLLERARMYGMTEQDAMSYSSERDLERTIFELDRRALNDGMRNQQQQAYNYHNGFQQEPQQPNYQQQFGADAYQQQPQYQQPPANQPPQPQPQQTPQQPEEFKLPEFELDVSLLDEGAAEVLGEMHNHYEQAFQKMLQHNQQVQQRVELAERFAQEQMQRQQREYQEQYMREFDSAINDLGEQFQEVLGQGVTGELNPQTQQFYNRDQLWRAQAIAMQQHAANGIRPNVKDVVANAARILFPQQYEKTLRAGVQNRAGRRQSQMVSRPTRRQSSQTASEQQQNKRESALRKVDQAFINAGLGVDPAGPMSDGI